MTATNYTLHASSTLNGGNATQTRVFSDNSSKGTPQMLYYPVRKLVKHTSKPGQEPEPKA